LGEEYRPGKRFEGQEKLRGKLLLLSEGRSEKPYPQDLYRLLTDGCASFLGTSVYTDLGNEHEGNAALFREWMYENSSRVTLYDAPYRGNFAFGISIIGKWFDEGLLELPEDSLVRKQLKQLTAGDFEEGDVEVRYFAVNALRFVVAAFDKAPARDFTGWQPDRSASRFW
jgi:hypothetical protein